VLSEVTTNTNFIVFYLTPTASEDYKRINSYENAFNPTCTVVSTIGFVQLNFRFGNFVNDDGSFLTLDQFSNKFGFCVNFLQYNGVITSLRQMLKLYPYGEIFLHFLLLVLYIHYCHMIVYLYQLMT
jgi:hypothetical protein